MEYNVALSPHRVKTAVIDSVIIVVMMYGASLLLASFETVPDHLRIVIFILLFLPYNPLLTSYFGGTIGHAKAGNMVKREKETF